MQPQPPNPFLFFPDNTVLVNFGLIGRVDLLEDVLRGQGRWCATVAQECADSATLVDELTGLSEVSLFLGAPLMPRDRAEWTDTLTLRGSMAAPGDPATKHMGEAETVVIISRRRMRAVFATDDAGAKRAADQEGIPTTTTRGLLDVAVRRGLITDAVRDGYIRVLTGQRRHLP